MNLPNLSNTTRVCCDDDVTIDHGSYNVSSKCTASTHALYITELGSASENSHKKLGIVTLCHILFEGLHTSYLYECDGVLQLSFLECVGDLVVQLETQGVRHYLRLTV